MLPISVPNSSLPLQLLPISVWSSSVELPLRCSGSLQQMQTKDSHTQSQLRVPMWRQSVPLPHQEACQSLWAVCRSWRSTLCQCRQRTVVDSAGHWQLQSEWWPLVSWVWRNIICYAVFGVLLHEIIWLASPATYRPFHCQLLLNTCSYLWYYNTVVSTCTYYDTVFLPISPIC